MDKEQQKEWAEAQKIVVSVDLVEAAKKQLKFLAAVDRNRYLYEDHALQWAIYRYNACWLPLLAKHLENPVSEDPLVVPLDCEWIWHCHRLNPIRYKLDCEKLFGRILGNYKVVSSVQAKSKIRTEEIWNKKYPEEPYELDINRSFPEDLSQNGPQNEMFTSYDLVSAVKRQIGFTFQVSRPHMSDDLFLQEAETRYKGFLHLIRTNRKMEINLFCVPTYDIDLMWHTHQLQPYYYCKDLIKLLGKVLQHDDTDSDKSKGSKLDTGFLETTKQWEETFGKRYWKAGAMNRGSTPTPVTHVPSELIYEGKHINPIENCDMPIIQCSARKAVEVFLELVEFKNLPEGHKDNLLVSFSKKRSDKLFGTKRSLSISESGEKQVAYFQCEPTGEFLFELRSQSSSDKTTPKSSKILGSCSLSLQELLACQSQLSTDKWLSLEPVSDLEISESILLHVFVSFTPPTLAPQVFHLKPSQDSQPFSKSSCFLPHLKIGNVKPDVTTQTNVTDDDGEVLFSLQKRSIVKGATKCTLELIKEVHYFTDSGEKRKVAEFLGENWVIRGMHGFLMLQKNSGNDGHLFELVGHKRVKLFPGRRLGFEPRQCGNRCEHDFITAVEFSNDHPYGRAITLFDLKLGTVKAQDEWIVMPGIILGFILPDILSREGYNVQSGERFTLKSVFSAGAIPAGVMNECIPAEIVETGGGRCLILCCECAGMIKGVQREERVTIKSGFPAGAILAEVMNKCIPAEIVETGGDRCLICCECVGMIESVQSGEKVGLDSGMVVNGGGKCDGGKCAGGKCGGIPAEMVETGGGKCWECYGCVGMVKSVQSGEKVTLDSGMVVSGGGNCGGGKCAGGKCGGISAEKVGTGGGKCLECYGCAGMVKSVQSGEKVALDSGMVVSGGGNCGGGKCAGGKCGGGKCGGISAEMVGTGGGKCLECYGCAGMVKSVQSGEKVALDSGMVVSGCGNCGGGKCAGGKCGGGKCGAIPAEMDYGGLAGVNISSVCGSRCGGVPFDGGCGPGSATAFHMSSFIIEFATA